MLGNCDSSVLVSIILGSILVLWIAFWIYTKCEKDDDQIVNEEKARYFLLYGRLNKNDKDAYMKIHFFKYYTHRLDQHKILSPDIEWINGNK